jgi:hypothetical protein
MSRACDVVESPSRVSVSSPHQPRHISAAAVFGKFRRVLEVGIVSVRGRENHACA